jgi:hypothetical protein
VKTPTKKWIGMLLLLMSCSSNAGRPSGPGGPYVAQDSLLAYQAYKRSGSFEDYRAWKRASEDEQIAALKRPCVPSRHEAGILADAVITVAFGPALETACCLWIQTGRRVRGVGPDAQDPDWAEDRCIRPLHDRDLPTRRSTAQSLMAGQRTPEEAIRSEFDREARFTLQREASIKFKECNYSPECMAKSGYVWDGHGWVRQSPQQ